MFNVRIFPAMLVHMSVIWQWQFRPFWIVSLFLTDKKLSKQFGMFLDLLLYEIMDQRNCIKLRLKN